MSLNLYLADANDKELEEALYGYGKAIKQLFSANIFPSDMFPEEIATFALANPKYLKAFKIHMGIYSRLATGNNVRKKLQMVFMVMFFLILTTLGFVKCENQWSSKIEPSFI